MLNITRDGIKINIECNIDELYKLLNMADIRNDHVLRRVRECFSGVSMDYITKMVRLKDSVSFEIADKLRMAMQEVYTSQCETVAEREARKAALDFSMKEFRSVQEQEAAMDSMSKRIAEYEGPYREATVHQYHIDDGDDVGHYYVRNNQNEIFAGPFRTRASAEQFISAKGG